MEKKSEGKTRKCLTLLGGRTSLLLCLSLTYIIHSGFISGYQNRYGDNLKLQLMSIIE